MPKIKPISDLRNYATVSRNCSGWEAFISHKKWSWLLYSYEH